MSRRGDSSAGLDRELRDLPDERRWRGWMGRVEAPIFASRRLVTRETLAGLVGSGCRLDDCSPTSRKNCGRGPRAELSRLAGRTISRDVIGRLKSHGVIDAGPRAPTPGAPIAWVTTRRFLEVFSLDSLEAAGFAERGEETEIDRALDDALGLETDDGEPDDDESSAEERT
jgi:chromosome segregation and condensation protein ScpB